MGRSSRRRMMYDAYHRKILVQFLRAFFSLLMNLPTAITLFTDLMLLRRKYGLNPWFLWLPYAKPQTRVFLEWASKFASRSQKVLDIGCGLCGVEVALQNQGFHDIVGVDIRSVNLKASNELLGKDRKIPLMRADANALPFRNQIFDTIAMLDLSYFKSINLEATFHEVCRLLKPKGVFLADFYEGSKTADTKKRYSLIGHVDRLLRACSLNLMRFFPVYHPGDTFPYGYLIMVKKEI